MQRTNIDGVNAELARLFPEEWHAIEQLRADGVRSLDPDYQSHISRVLPALEWADPWHHPELDRSELAAFEQAVYEAVVGDDPEWAVTGTLAGYDRTAEFFDLPPTLVLGGRYDRLTPPDVADEILDSLDPARRAMRIFERSAHRPWAEEPDEYFRAVKNFLGDRDDSRWPG